MDKEQLINIINVFPTIINQLADPMIPREQLVENMLSLQTQLQAAYDLMVKEESSAGEK